ncbi:hypothetical protein, partial [Stenotrophomonas maltophilia]|uniref:hypothetical protein n=1 Tax=Stenotrophomonas maltophilia TaxID=40324 RepID=UPI001C655E98
DARRPALEAERGVGSTRASAARDPFLIFFLLLGWTRAELVGGGANGLHGGVSRMDAATEPYLMKICQRRCREPAWAAVRAWISTIAM